MKSIFSFSDTIFAPATTVISSGVCVIRISGPNAQKAISALVAPKKFSFKPRFFELCFLSDPVSNELVDHALVVFFPAPHSFTGEDVIELHCHGSVAVIRWMLRILAAMEGLRFAEAGEFSRRAFVNGKLDLTAAEGLADLIEAETAAQAKQALRQMSGALASLYGNWRSNLIHCMAALEAYIDFPDEEIPPSVVDEVTNYVQQLIVSLQNHLADERRGERLRAGFFVTILGAPNAGKSSLLNAIAKRDVAIVSDQAGTTRDVLEVRLDIDGYPFILQDTAGIRDTDNAIEQEGIRRAKNAARDSDLRLFLFDASCFSEKEVLFSEVDENSIVVFSKCDLEPNFSPPETKSRKVFLLSVVDNNWPLSDLLAYFSELAKETFSLSEAPLITRERHRKIASDSVLILEQFSSSSPLEISAEILRSAATSLGRISGHIGLEDVLDELFSRFCIGK